MVLLVKHLFQQNTKKFNLAFSHLYLKRQKDLVQDIAIGYYASNSFNQLDSR